MKVELIGKKIILKTIQKTDAEDLYENIKDKEISKYSGPYSSTSIRNAIKYIKKCSDNIQKKESYCLGIYLKENNKLIGNIGLIDLDWKNKKCEIGFWIGKNFWNKGYMTEAVLLITEYGFKTLNLHKISAVFHEQNIGSEKVLIKSGFKKEGILKDSIFLEGKYFNEIIYGKIK